jgi:hypothetical protein
MNVLGADFEGDRFFAFFGIETNTQEPTAANTERAAILNDGGDDVTAAEAQPHAVADLRDAGLAVLPLRHK